MLRTEGFDRVRVAGPRDEEEIMDAVRRMHDDNEWALLDATGRALSLSEDRVRTTLSRALFPVKGVAPAWIGIIGEPGRLESSIYLSLETPWCSDEPFLAEIWAYTLHMYRRSDNAAALIQFSKAIAQMLKVPLAVGVATAPQSAAKSRLLQRALGAPVGSLFLYQGAA